MQEQYPAPVTATTRRREAARQLLIAAAALWIADDPPSGNPWSLADNPDFPSAAQAALADVFNHLGAVDRRHGAW